MQSQTDLQQLLQRIDHKGYPAYKDTRGAYRFGGYELSIDHVQGDPFAAPSRVSIHIAGKDAGFPQELFDTKEKRIMLQDYLLRKFARAAGEYSFQAKGSGKSGLLAVSRCGQEILERTACQIDGRDGSIIVRLGVGFPANGRTVNARELEKILFVFLPKCVKSTLFYASADKAVLRKNADLAEDQCYIRNQLKDQNLVAFVANGAILPRESGVSDRPMKQAVAFTSPESLEVTMQLPHHGELKGMGIRRGVTLIVGGGYHGKSTLLKAVELGVYDHIAGDGREYVITDETAMKIRAEDGRSIKHVDISMFINHLPNGKDTASFSTEDASGSTSQAANVVEAMEMGTHAFLIDEDTSATNFMIRDELMQRVVSREVEPITPFVDRICELYQVYGISTVLVAGSSGSYFHKADVILQMENYKPKDITEFAKKEAAQFPLVSQPVSDAAKPEFARCPLAESKKNEGGTGSHAHGRGRGGRPDGAAREERVKIKTTGCDTISLNRENIDMRYVEQLVDEEQMSALGYILSYAAKNCFDGRKTLQQAVEEIYQKIETQGMKAVCGDGTLPAGLCIPRKQEIYACVDRYRGLRF